MDSRLYPFLRPVIFFSKSITLSPLTRVLPQPHTHEQHTHAFIQTNILLHTSPLAFILILFAFWQAILIPRIRFTPCYHIPTFAFCTQQHRKQHTQVIYGCMYSFTCRHVISSPQITFTLSRHCSSVAFFSSSSTALWAVLYNAGMHTSISYSPQLIAFAYRNVISNLRITFTLGRQFLLSRS
jgi:hypothetical protein